jgi:hypothetical protein
VIAALTPRHLGRRSPPSAWEAYFLIGIFPGHDGGLTRDAELRTPSRSAPHTPGGNGGLRWSKLHLFSGGAGAGRHCLSAVEALDGPPERLLLRATGAEVIADRRPLAADELQRPREGWDVRASGLIWTGPFPDLHLGIADPRITAEAHPRDVLWWVRLPRVLSYWSAFGPLVWEGPDGRSAGLGIVEHAWGADTRLDVARLAPRRWHWDVLSFSDGGFAAGLALGIGPSLLGPRSGGRIGEGPFAYGRGIQVEILSHREEKGRRVPDRWRGTLTAGEGTLHYEARASTPVADTVPGGGFLGFSFEGEWRPRRGPSKPAHGDGFCEYRAAG